MTFEWDNDKQQSNLEKHGSIFWMWFGCFPTQCWNGGTTDKTTVKNGPSPLALQEKSTLLWYRHNAVRSAG